MKPVEYLSDAEAATYLRFVTPDGKPKLAAFRKWVERKKVKRYRIGPRTTRFKRVDLDRHIEAVGGR